MEQLVSVQVGQPREMPPAAGSEGTAPLISAIFKDTVTGPVWVGRDNLAGDAQADTRNHGGPDQAVLAYSAYHYLLWREELGLPHLAYGAFGENLTVTGQSEDTVCIGDVYQIGPVILQVSQPRGPCVKLDRRNGVPGLAARSGETGRTGWYLRVFEEGTIEAGMAIVLLERALPEWTITRAHTALRLRSEHPELARSLAACASLGRRWRELLQRSA